VEYRKLPKDKGVRSYGDFTMFPTIGQFDAIYIDLASGETYFWDGSMYVLSSGGGGGGAAWGGITGTLSDQTDLQTALDAKLTVPLTPTSFWSQRPTFPSSLNYNFIDTDYFGATGFPLDQRAVGTGSSVAQGDASNTSTGLNSTQKALGVLQLQTGTTTTGRAYAGVGRPDTFGGIIRFGAQEIRLGQRISMPLLSTGTETFTLFVGIFDIGSATPNNGVFFRYTDGVNGGRWEYCKAIGGTTTPTDTGIAATANNSVGDHHNFEIVINRAGTTADFYIDGAFIGTHTTLPTVNGMCAGTNMLKSAGTTNRLLFMDAYYLYSEYLR
jgi:hypothetical protein